VAALASIVRRNVFMVISAIVVPLGTKFSLQMDGPRAYHATFPILWISNVRNPFYIEAVTGKSWGGQMAAIAYSPLKDDLFFPCKNAKFFADMPPNSEAALCAEMSRLAYCSKSPQGPSLDFAFDKDKINSALAKIHFSVSDSNFFESKGHSRNQGTHCFIAQREDNGLAVVAFRGTDKNDPTNVINDDANIILVEWPRGGKVHAGFYNGLKEVLAPLQQVLADLKGRLLITGHSLGAAMAILLASEYKASAKQPFALYTFGSPRVGNPEFATTLKEANTYRFVDCCDDVTLIPIPVPIFFPYEHVGKPFYIFEDRHTEFDPPTLRIVQDQLEARSRYSFKYLPSLSDLEQNVATRGLADHAPVNYVAAVNAVAAKPDGTLPERAEAAQP
jgi:hypothetical protein